MNEYYIYIYLDPRSPGKYCYENFSLLYKPFYIGKGKEKRAYDKINRSNYWKSIVNKYGYEILIIELELSEEQSFTTTISLWNPPISSIVFNLSSTFQIVFPSLYAGTITDNFMRYYWWITTQRNPHPD